MDETSLYSPGQQEHHYNNVECRYHQLLAQFAGLNYMGTKLDLLWAPLPGEVADHWFSSGARSAYRIREIAVDPSELSKIVRKAVLANERITFVGDAEMVLIYGTGH